MQEIKITIKTWQGKNCREGQTHGKDGEQGTSGFTETMILKSTHNKFRFWFIVYLFHWFVSIPVNESVL